MGNLVVINCPQCNCKFRTQPIIIDGIFKAALQINKDVEEINPESSLVVLRVNLPGLVQRYTKKAILYGNVLIVD